MPLLSLAKMVVIAALDPVRGFSTRNPWMPDRVRHDSR
jgi:hypothetical protein